MSRVLVVDDCIDTAIGLSRLLSAWGHETRTAHDGCAALATAEDFTPDVALVDIVLPRMDGYEVARELRTMPGLENAFLVALTGYASGQGRRAPEADFDICLLKPVNLDELKNLLNFCACPPN